MTKLEQIVDEIERHEADEEMYFSLYEIPQEYSETDEYDN